MLTRSALLILLLASAAHANPNCPSNYIQAGPAKNSTNPTETSSGSSSADGCPLGSGSSGASYSIPGASFSVSASVSGECGAQARITMNDDFRVIGLPAGTPVAIGAVLHLHGYWSGATMSDAFGHQVQLFTDYEVNDGEATLPIAAIAEQPFRLTIDSRAGADYSITGSSGSGGFRFTDLPVGAAVVSCNGYVSDQSVAARPTTWGKLKRIYR